MEYRYHTVDSRLARTTYIVAAFKELFEQADSVLDVGSSEGSLKKLLGTKVKDLDVDEADITDDVAGKPDFTVNLEHELLSSFQDNEFDVIVCSDVLEHLNNFHQTLEDLVRVARSHVIIALPNCTNTWRALRILFKQTAGRQWGLPINSRQDRHKWFFSWREIDTFFTEWHVQQPVAIKRRFLLFNNSGTWRGRLITSLLKAFPIPSFSETYYIVLTKEEPQK